MRTILIYGNDDILVTTRRLILERAGHRLFTTCFADAMLVLMTEPVEILLLCQSLKAEERRGIVETAHAVRPDMKCTVLGIDGPDNDGSDGRVFYDWLDGPTALLKTIDRMLPQQDAAKTIV